VKKQYHGWILVESGGRDLKDFIYIEYTDEQGKRIRKLMENRGNSGAAEAVEFWDRKVGQSVKLEPMILGMYRVYTGEGSV
jgi:hypothetical protein